MVEDAASSTKDAVFAPCAEWDVGNAVFGDLTCCGLQRVVGEAWDFGIVLVLDLHFLLCNHVVLNRCHQRPAHVLEAGTGALAGAGKRCGTYRWTKGRLRRLYSLAPCRVKLDMVISPT